MSRTITSLVAVALLAAPLQHPPASAASRPGGRPATPTLLRAEVAEGRLRRAQADLYMLYALGGDRRLPARFRSHAPWDGTLPLLHVRRRIGAMDPGPARARLRQELETQGLTCDGEVGGPDVEPTSHFRIEYEEGTIEGGLTIDDYAASLETTWDREVTEFGWAAPPLASARYLVVVANLGDGLYGFVSSTGSANNNPNTPWNEGDARYSCMALNRDFTQFPSPAQDALDGTTAHEFNHSIQFGYGALDGIFPHDTYIEGGATWMEDEVFDDSNDNYNYLWPQFHEGMDSYPLDDPYPYWITFRGLTERFGTGAPGGGEQVMEDFWELVSKNQANNRTAINLALRNQGTNLGLSLHDYAIAVKFLHPCGGGYPYPHCFEEAAGYEAAAGLPRVHRTIGIVGGSATSAFEPLGLNWVRIPEDAGAYGLTLTSSDTGGRFRASAVCDTGTGFEISPFPQKVQKGQSTTLLDFDSDGCQSAVAVLTNEGATGGARNRDAYTLATAQEPPPPGLRIANASVTEGNAGSKAMTFTVSLSSSTSETITVDYATKTVAGGAKAGVDFVPESGIVAFSPGDTAETLTIAVRGDTVQEENERFRVILSSPSGATIADGTAVGTIIDND
jgi:Calx-beta domain-containing protein